jgi:hypothetical protein
MLAAQGHSEQLRIAPNDPAIAVFGVQTIW